MRKLILFLVLILASVSFMGACSKKKTVDENSLIGKWDSGHDFVIEFLSDGTLVTHDETSGDVESAVTGTWVDLGDGHLEITNDYLGESEISSFEVKDDTLTLGEEIFTRTKDE